MAPTLVASRTALPPEGAAAPAARQSRFRGPCWREGTPPRLSLRVLRCPPRGLLRLRPGKAGSVAPTAGRGRPHACRFAHCAASEGPLRLRPGKAGSAALA